MRRIERRPRGRLDQHARQDAGGADLQGPLRARPHDYDEDVMASIVADLLAMAGDPEAANV